MEYLPFTLKGLTCAQLMEEIENIPSGAESIVDEDEDDESEHPLQNTICIENLVQDGEDDISDDLWDSDDDIPLINLVQKQEYRIGNDSNIRSPKWGITQAVNPAPPFEHNCGITDIVRNVHSTTPYAFFKLIFTDDLLQYLVFHTNLYATQEGMNFIPTTLSEMKIFLGINILMGIKPLPSYRDYWSSSPDMHDAYISQFMSVNRFGWLLTHMHLNDNSLLPQRNQPNYDKLYKVRPFLNMLSENLEKCLLSHENIAIDESMIRFKGRSSIKQYLPKKPIKRGYKVWCLADQSGYLYRFQIYTGKVGNMAETNLGERVVKDLTKGLQNKDHKLYIDNYFCSYPLLLYLKENAIWTCGTINYTRKNIPKMKDDKQLTRGETDWKTSDSGLSIFKWKDKRSVHLLSNYHDPNLYTIVKRKEKNGTSVDEKCPGVLQNYNKSMGFVDKLDQLKSYFEINRQSRRWWHRIFFHFVDIAVVNSYILFRLSGEEITHKDFRRRVIDGLVAEKIVSLKRKRNNSPLEIEKHKLQVSIEVRLDSSAHQPGRGTRRICAVCSTKTNQVRTEWTCTICKVPLCLSKTKTCFQDFHSKA